MSSDPAGTVPARPPGNGSAGSKLCVRALGHRKMPLAAKGALALTSVT